jgi:predicted DNA-binding protein (UPF0251 family)
MPRKKCCRKIGLAPKVKAYKPTGVKMCAVEKVSLDIDEFEAVRLADYEGLYQQDGAERMEISRATFGRILTAAHKKIAEALIEGKAIIIQNGDAEHLSREHE